MGSIKAFISFINEHGIFAKKDVIEKFSNPEFVTVRYPKTNKYSIEKLFDFSKINPSEESKMLLSLFDSLATHHYYFLSEYEFTEKIEWKPRQYEFLSRVNKHFELNENRKEYKTFKELYSKVETVFIESMIYLRDKGYEPYNIYRSDAELQEYIETASKKLFEKDLVQAYKKADVVIGCGTFLTLTDYPIDLAYQYSGIDVGHGSYTSEPKSITVNPFIFYWTITNFFKLQKQLITSKCINIELLEMLEMLGVTFIDATKLKVRAYSPSEIVSKTLIAGEGVKIVKENLNKIVDSNPIIQQGEFLAPFTTPCIVLEIEIDENDETPLFVDSTPYGVQIYEKFGLPKVTTKTQFQIELFNNPAYNRNLPLVLDTNVIDVGAFPYNSDSLFFEVFMREREIIIPSPVIYELKRKLQIGKEKEKVIKALSRLQEYKSLNFIKLTISGKLSEEAATNELLVQLTIKEKKGEEKSSKHVKQVKMAKSDIRDTMILLEAIRSNGVLFTNDKDLRILATLLGVPTISYNSLLDDVYYIIRKEMYKNKSEKINKNKIIKLVKEYALKTRGERYKKEDIASVLGYLMLQNREIRELLK